jgi:exopolyphosphatase/guanosine-5'-triphosphate,3'-diphosphate pyrophosphatase
LKVGVVDIGTNSMRLLLVDGSGDFGRWEEVTGLGRGVDATGELSESAILDSLTALARYGSLMDEVGVTKRAAVATSASRDASNREAFFDRVEQVLGVRPALISGAEEGALAYAGATRDLNLPGPTVVSDIGGGSTEFATEAGGVSVEIGSVRLTERHLPNRPASSTELTGAREKVARLFAAVEIPPAGSS